MKENKRKFRLTSAQSVPPQKRTSPPSHCGFSLILITSKWGTAAIDRDRLPTKHGNLNSNRKSAWVLLCARGLQPSRRETFSSERLPGRTAHGLIVCLNTAVQDILIVVQGCAIADDRSHPRPIDLRWQHANAMLSYDLIKQFVPPVDVDIPQLSVSDLAAKSSWRSASTKSCRDEARISSVCSPTSSCKFGCISTTRNACPLSKHLQLLSLRCFLHWASLEICCAAYDKQSILVYFHRKMKNRCIS